MTKEEIIDEIKHILETDPTALRRLSLYAISNNLAALEIERLQQLLSTSKLPQVNK